MSYSCRRDADTTYREWSEYCYTNTGVSNTYVYKDKRYTFIHGREQRDGAITGSVYLLLDNPDIQGQYLAYKKGSFRIEPNGITTRYPAGLNNLLMEAEQRHTFPCGGYVEIMRSPELQRDIERNNI